MMDGSNSNYVGLDGDRVDDSGSDQVQQTGPTSPLIVRFDPEVHESVFKYTLTGFRIVETESETEGGFDVIGEPSTAEMVFYGSAELAFNLKTVTYDDGFVGKEIESIVGELFGIELDGEVIDNAYLSEGWNFAETLTTDNHGGGTVVGFGFSDPDTDQEISYRFRFEGDLHQIESHQEAIMQEAIATPAADGAYALANFNSGTQTPLEDISIFESIDFVGDPIVDDAQENDEFGGVGEGEFGGELSLIHI